MVQQTDLTNDLKTKARDLGENVKSKAVELGENAAASARSDLDDTVGNISDRAAEQTSRVANAADAAGAEFDPDSFQAQAANQVATQVENLANRLRGTDLNTITRDVSNFARRNPLLFVGGAAVLGLAAARFLKARDPQRVDPIYEANDPWNSTDVPRANTGGFDVPS